MIDKSKYVRTENTKNLFQSPRKKDLKMKKKTGKWVHTFYFRRIQFIGTIIKLKSVKI